MTRKEKDIRKLLMIMDAVGASEKIIESLMSSFPMPEIRPELRERIEKAIIKSIDVKGLVEISYENYNDNYTHKEIKGMLAFYGSPLGQKIIESLPRITATHIEKSKGWADQANDTANAIVRDFILQDAVDNPTSAAESNFASLMQSLLSSAEARLEEEGGQKWRR